MRPQRPPAIPFCAQKALAGDGAGHASGVFADPNIDVTWYGLDLSIHTTPPLLAGRVTVRAFSLRDSLRTITLDLSGAMHVDSVRAGGHPPSFRSISRPA